MSTYSYLSALAIMDISVLLVGLLRLWIAEITGSDVQDVSDVTCKLVSFLGYVCSDSSVWLIITVTTERYIAVCYPLKTQVFCKIERAWKISLLPIVVICAINSHFFFTVSIQQKLGKAECAAGPSFELLVNNIWPWVDAVIYSFLPFLIIGILNGFIIRKISKAEKERKRFLQVKQHSARVIRRYKSSDYNKKLTTMLLSVSFTFLVTTIPMNIVLIFTAFWNKQTDNDVKGAAIFHLIKTISELLMYVNHSINFFLYCATGQKFRKSLLKLFCRKRYGNFGNERTFFTSVGQAHSP
ncbi:FMRFamide receptor-like [Saccostrea cucullata]|uniref:FMRFamide receptor-like n=1 Tax=Saccostrea cuccullata TaxID=36930 RepID=UPI002ED652ED